MIDYFNPNSLNPQNGWRPQGPAGGFMAAQDRMRFQQMSDLQQQLIEMERQKREEELIQGRPVRDAERSSLIPKHQLNERLYRGQMADPRYIPSQVEGSIGEGWSKFAKGYTDKETMVTGAEAGNERNRTDSENNRYKRLITHFDQFGDLGNPQSSLDPNVQQRWKAFREGLPGSMRNRLSEGYTGQTSQQFNALRQALMNTIEHTRAKDLETHKSTEKIREIKETGDWHKEVARIRLQQKNQSYKEMLEKALFTKDDRAALRAEAAILADPDASPQLKEMAERIGEQARKNIASKADERSFAPGDINNPEGAGARVLERLQRGGQNQPQQRQSMTQLRRLYPGRTDQWLKERYKKRYGMDPLPN